MMIAENHLQYLVPKQDIKFRIEQFQAALTNSGISVARIAHPTDLFYYTGTISDGICLVPAKGEPIFFVKKSIARAKEESPLPVLPYPGSKTIFSALFDLAQNEKNIGLPFDVTPASTYVQITKKLPGIEIQDLSNLMRMQKAVKSLWEQDQIRGATAQVKDLFENIKNVLKAGMTELELSGALEGRLRSIGHGGTTRIRRPDMELTTMMAVSGDSGLYPTNFDGPVGGEAPYPSAAAGPGWKVIEVGETVMVDAVTSHNGYHSDNARCFFMGNEIPAAAQKAHDFCLECLSRLERAIRPGAVCEEVFQEVDRWAKTVGEPEGFMGFGENRIKFFGHGVGLELDEFPIIADRVKLPLAAGMVVAVEPKAFLPGIGPVGAENTYLVTNSGCKSFLDHPPEIARID